MKGKRSFLLITLFISLLMFITGCWESDKTNTPTENQNVTLTAITVSPPNPSLNIGETIQFTATGTYSDNSTRNITDSVTWASSNISVSNIIARGVTSLSGGLASTITSGTTLITATLEGITSPARTLTVYSTIVTTLDSITVSPVTASISLGEGNSYTAIGAYDDGSTKDITNLVTWISSDKAIATIEAGGYTAPLSFGTTQITATMYGITSIPRTLTVTNPTLNSIDVTPINPSVSLGGTKQFTATGTYSNNSTQDITDTVTWASSNKVIATIGTGGLATAQTVGETQISATLKGITSDPQKLSITSLVSIAISPTNKFISLGGIQQFTATGIYYDESTQDLTDKVTWASSNEVVATIGSDGLATAQSIGETQITAILGGVTASAQTLSVCVSSNILMGEIPITDPNQVEDTFNDTVQAVKDAVQEMTPVDWMIMGEIEMPFSAGSYGTLLEVGAPMFADDAMAMGQHHALGMPCKIGIWTEDSDEDDTDDLIKINILNEAVVFSFFFADVMDAEGFDDFAEMIKAQMKGMVQTAVNNLNGNWIYEYQPPFYTQEELTAIQSWVTSGGYAGESGYGISLEIPFAGNKDEGQSDPNFLSEVKNNIMSAIGNTPYARDDWHVINQNFNIPVGDYTNSNNPFADIGEIKLCSAYYAAQVVGMGGKYMVAMPCTVSVWLNDLTWDSQGMPAYQEPDKVIVSILNPEFILQNYFTDIVPFLPAAMQEQMANMGIEIKNQVLAMVNRGLKEYSYPNHLSPRLSTNILMGKIPISAEDTPEVAFNAAVQAVRDAVAGYSFVPQVGSNTINPWMVVGEIEMLLSEGSYGTLLEVCAPMFADDAMAMGQHHALGMPCKIGVWTEDSDEDGTDDLIKINTLDESAIFAFYFADVMSAPGFDDFAAMIKTQMKEMVKSAVNDQGGNWIFEHQPPFFTRQELTAIQSWVTSGGYAGESGYGINLEIPFEGNKDEGQSDPNFLSEVKNSIMSAIGNTPYARDDWHVINQNFNIPVGDYTNPNNPFATIGEIKLCSAYYAAQVVGMGGKYMVALPCNVSVWLNDLTMNDQGTPAYQEPNKVIVSILNPEFILQNYFKDIVPFLPAAMQEQMADMGAEIKNQVLAMVNRGLKEYSYPNHLFPRLSTNILMGKIAIAAEDTPEDAFNVAVQAVRDAVAGYSFVPQVDSNAINPWKVVEEIEMPFPGGSYGTLLEVCAPMFADDAMSMGQHHALGMPCKIGVWTEDSDGNGTDDLIKINTLDESAIFAFYFADVMSAPGFDDFAAMIKTQMKEMVKSAVSDLGGDWIFEHQPPFFTKQELAAVQSWATSEGGYSGENGFAIVLEIPLAGNKDEGQSYADFLKEIKNNIISVIDIDDDPPYDARADWHVIDPNFIIPVGDYTDPNNPFADIGEIKLCSPYYAEMIVNMGGQYMVSMPCTISVWLNDLTWDSQGMPVYQTPDKVMVGILNPEFILENFFKDLPEDIQQQMAGMGSEITNQIQAIVDHALTSIDVTPTDVHLSPGGTEQFTAVWTYSDSNTKDITHEVTWSSSDESVAVISAEGLATAVSFGETEITATLDGVTSSSQKLSVSVSISGSILKGEIAISSADEVQDTFNDAVQAVKVAINEFSFTPQIFMPPINPFWAVVGEIEMPFPEGSYGTLLEVCAPILADDAMAMGQHHALGMPCKIGIWTEDDNEDGTDDVVKINILNESFIFSVYFADVLGAEGFDQFESIIKSQMGEIVDAAIIDLGGELINEPQSPFYTQEELTALQSWVADGGFAGDNGYGITLEVPLAGNKTGGQSNAGFLGEVKNNIIAAIGQTPYASDEWHVIDPNFSIPVGDTTNPQNPFAGIGEIKVCSPYYAAQVIGLGGQNMVAMPCTISVWLNDLTMDDQGMPAYQEPNKVIVGILNPEFILQNYFKDVIPSLPASMQEQMANMGAEIKNQVLAMVNYGIRGYSYPDHLFPRVSTNILMGKVSIPTDEQPAYIFDAAVQAVKDVVNEFGDGNTVASWIVVGQADMPFLNGSYGTLLEICAPAYAAAAMGMGQHHALGMPCKIGVWTEDTDNDMIDDIININMLDESVIFGFYFADVANMPGFDDFAAMIKTQTKQMVKTAVTNLEGVWIFEHQPPFFTREELSAVQYWADDEGGGYAGDNGYGIQLEIPLAWNKNDEEQTEVEFLSEIKNDIISAIGNTPEALSDWHVINKHFNIPVGNDPNISFANIGEIKLCSPSYAAQIVGLGGKYMVAMPCTISVWLNDLTWDSQGMPIYQTPDKVIVGILNPEFILQNYFNDIIPTLPTNVQEQMAGMGPVIKEEILAMVHYALEDLHLRGLWDSQFELVSGLARAYLAELEDGTKSPVIKAENLYPITTNSNIMDNPFILSVRSFEHYQVGHIVEAVNIPWQSLADEGSLLQLPTDDTQIVTYCYTGHSGQVAATLLNILGYNAINLKYGICSWTTDQEVRVATAFDPNDGHDFDIDPNIYSMSELSNYDPPILSFDAESALEIGRLAAANYLDSGSAPTITAQNLYYLISDENLNNDPFIISVRSSAHYQDPNIEHIPGAYNIPFKNIADDENLRKLSTDRQIVTYCYTGHTGQLAATILNILGYDAVNLKFGMMSWTKDPVARVVQPFNEELDSHDYDLNYGLTP